jgi:Holliday junction resolvasome RuvABC endonuclease subunit
MTQPKTILGIDPGTKEMGLAVLCGRQLLAYGVHTLRNGERPYDLIGQARRIVLGYVARYAPQVVAIEAPLMLPTRRAAILSVIAQELRGRAKELNLEVVEITPQDVRQAVVGNPKATKIEVAEALVGRGFEALKELVPKRPARAALGLRPRDKYWLHMFDAVALAVAASTSGSARSQVGLLVRRWGPPRDLSAVRGDPCRNRPGAARAGEGTEPR